jgi:hypothetical protein
LDFAEIRQSLPQVSFADSRNEMGFCNTSIQTLSEARPYVTLADLRLFVEGWFLAKRWYTHTDNGGRNVELAGSSAYPDDGNSMPLSVVPQSAKHDLQDPPPSRE